MPRLASRTLLACLILSSNLACGDATEPASGEPPEETRPLMRTNPEPVDGRASDLPSINSLQIACGDASHVFDTTTWGEAADAVVVGTVVEVGVVDDYAVSIVDQPGSAVLHADACALVGTGAFRVVLEDIVTLAGREIARAEIRFGAGTWFWWHAPGQPRVEDGALRWSDDGAERIEPGMRIGGALYYIEEFDFYSFESGGGQPIFQVLDDGVVAFQTILNARCMSRPPVELLTGISLDDLAAEIRAASRWADPTRRESNIVRRLLGLDSGEVPRYRAERWFPLCIPVGAEVFDREW